jgi:hypothetical protein
MKARFLFVIFLSCWSTAVNSQTEKEISFFNDFRLSYSVSSMTAGGDYFKRHESLIPYGTSLEASILSFKRFSLEIGFEYRNSGNQIIDGIMFTDPIGYSGPFHQETLDQYFDVFPHISYKVIKTNLFNVQILAGPKATFKKTRFLFRTDEENILNTSMDNVGLDLGLIESFKILDKLYLFTGQFRNQYFGKYHFLKTIDLKLGMSLRF